MVIANKNEIILQTCQCLYLVLKIHCLFYVPVYTETVYKAQYYCRCDHAMRKHCCCDSCFEYRIVYRTTCRDPMSTHSLGSHTV